MTVYAHGRLEEKAAALARLDQLLLARCRHRLPSPVAVTERPAGPSAGGVAPWPAST